MAEYRSHDPAALRPQPARDGGDFWPTPSCLTAALTRRVLPELPAGPVWEPAAGDGCLADALAAAGRRVIASDIEPRRYDVLRHDFLHDPPPRAAHGAILATNPPFRDPLLDRFMTRILVLLGRGKLRAAVLLLRADHLTAAGRAGALNRAAAIWTCCWRPRWIPGSTGNGRWSFCWIVWQAGDSGPPISRWLTAADFAQPGLALDQPPGMEPRL